MTYARPAGSNRARLLALNKRHIIFPLCWARGGVLGVINRDGENRESFQLSLMHSEVAQVYFSFQRNKWFGN